MLIFLKLAARELVKSFATWFDSDFSECRCRSHRIHSSCVDEEIVFVSVLAVLFLRVHSRKFNCNTCEAHYAFSLSFSFECHGGDPNSFAVGSKASRA